MWKRWVDGVGLVLRILDNSHSVVLLPVSGMRIAERGKSYGTLLGHGSTFMGFLEGGKTCIWVNLQA